MNANSKRYDYPDGSQLWLTNKFKWHREDGPAFINGNGQRIEWYLHDTSYDFSEYCDLLNLSEENIIILKLKYGC